MKFLCSIERIAIIRWVTIAYIGALVLPVLFLRYGNIIAVAHRVTHHAPNCHGRSSFIAC